MKITPLDLPDLLLCEPSVIRDERGFFMESFNSRNFARATGLEVDFVQDNHSYSRGVVLRGLHYQLPPHAQGKLVRVLVGEIFDVVVDIRRNSPSFSRWSGINLSAENKRQLWIPQGFAHGFLTLSEHTEIFYKTTDYYAADCDCSFSWNDPALAIDWPLRGTPNISAKDAAAPSLAQARVFT